MFINYLRLFLTNDIMNLYYVVELNLYYDYYFFFSLQINLVINLYI